ncbi:UDP-N-acetylglucosamine transferase subunit ALG14 homolog [Culicoides brevitarsis]|uniref:UDP-N-acetylglucosamine transferase subunit ALG14 homolog n=1 Tax=Culicoides brevitarsis TaxID=469753 RepID=UPI00307B484C
MILYSVVFCLLFIFIRVIYLLIVANRSNGSASSKKRTAKAKTMIVLGSGGHTAEMLEIVRELDIEKYAPRIYITAKTDTNSILRLVDTEIAKEPEKEKHNFEIVAIARSREVKQSYLTAIFSTLHATLDCIPVLVRTRPDLILTNGPGTCVPVCLVAFWLKIFFFNTNCRIVYVESYCRVKTLSLSGKLLIWMSDLFVAQWPDVAKCAKKIQYFGRLS